jgi:hypothetical protein
MRRRPGGLWRHGDFLWLWSSQTVSQFGSQVSMLALPLVAISILEESAFKVAMLGMVEFLPFLLLSLPAGVWVDRLRRKPILVAADVLRALALVSVPVAYWLDALAIWQLYIVGFVVGVGTVFFDVAYQSFLPTVVARDQLSEGNSKLEVSRSAAQLAGPGAAGVLIGILTAPVAVLADAISFLVSAILVGRVAAEERQPVTGDRRSLVSELWEGLRYVIKHEYVRGMAASCSGLGTWAFSSALSWPSGWRPGSASAGRSSARWPWRRPACCSCRSPRATLQLRSWSRQARSSGSASSSTT